MADVAMPRLSDSMEEGTIVRWLKGDGDQVSKGEELVEIETDKATMTYEADEDGVLETVASEGDTLPVGEVIARIGEGGGSSRDGGSEDAAEEEAAETAPDADGETSQAPSDDADEAETAREPEPAAASADGDGDGDAHGDGDGDGDGDGERIKASPVARRLAEEHGVDLSSLDGTGPGGRIVKADVEAAAEGAGDGGAREDEAPAEAAPQPAARKGEGGARGEAETHELSRLQQLVARRMAESKATAPDFSITVEVDMDAAVDLRRELSEASPDDTTPSFNEFVIKAAALALRDFPRANGAYRDAKFELYSRVNVGMAVAGQDALVVPTIFDADKKSLGEIARDAKALAAKVREGAITPPELSGGTFTVSNLGMYGIKRFTAVLNPPQAGILAVGALEPRAVVRDGEVQVRNTMELTLTCDHRILYGAEAAEFLGRIRERLEQPLMLAL